MTQAVLAKQDQSFDVVDTPLSAREDQDEVNDRIGRFRKMLAAAFMKRCARMLPADWRILLWSKETDEAEVSSVGAVEIRRIPGGCLAQTWVKGDMTLARGTALLRLAKYLGGENQRAVRLDAARPVLQQQKAPGLWQVSVRLPAVNDLSLAPRPRGRKVKIVAQEPTVWAVVTRAGRPSERGIERAETAIMDAIARSFWFPAGPAVVRIHTPTPLLSLAGSYEVAVPVVAYPPDQSLGNCIGFSGGATNRPVHQPSPPVH